MRDAGLLDDWPRHRTASALGDRACLALEKRLRIPVLTADRIWAEVPVCRGGRRPHLFGPLHAKASHFPLMGLD
jgi:hypothetical protein